MAMNFERQPISRRRPIVTSLLYCASLALVPSCSESGQTAQVPKIDVTQPHPPAIAGCIETPSLRSSMEALKVEVEKRDGGQYNSVAGTHTIYEGQEWIVGSNWGLGTSDDFHWLKESKNRDDKVNYYLNSDGQLLVNNHPRKPEQYDGTYFKDSEYEPVCDPAQIDELRQIIEPMPLKKNCYFEEC
jgi:hypothetical protein